MARQAALREQEIKMDRSTLRLSTGKIPLCIDRKDPAVSSPNARPLDKTIFFM
jgi:hypothetical protein